MKDKAGLLPRRHTNLLLQNGFTVGVIALQRPRPVIHAFPVGTPCKEKKKKSSAHGWENNEIAASLPTLFMFSNTCWVRRFVRLFKSPICIQHQTLRSADSVLVQATCLLCCCGRVCQVGKLKHPCNFSVQTWALLSVWVLHRIPIQQ